MGIVKKIDGVFRICTGLIFSDCEHLTGYRIVWDERFSTYGKAVKFANDYDTGIYECFSDLN